MESNAKVKLHLIVGFYDPRAPFGDRKGFKFLVDNSELPSIMVAPPFSGGELHALASKYLKHDSSELSFKLIDCTLEGDTVNIIYYISLLFVKGSLVQGQLATIYDLEDLKINDTARRYITGRPLGY